jgi:hypothetical protein
MAAIRRRGASLDLVKRGQRWSPYWPRQLLAFAERQAIATEGPRYIGILIVGFGGLVQPRRIAAALTELIRAKVRIALGRERLIYTSDRHMLISAAGTQLRPWRNIGDRRRRLSRRPTSSLRHKLHRRRRQRRRSLLHRRRQPRRRRPHGRRAAPS